MTSSIDGAASSLTVVSVAGAAVAPGRTSIPVSSGKVVDVDSSIAPESGGAGGTALDVSSPAGATDGTVVASVFGLVVVLLDSVVEELTIVAVDEATVVAGDATEPWGSGPIGPGADVGGAALTGGKVRSVGVGAGRSAFDEAEHATTARPAAAATRSDRW